MNHELEQGIKELLKPFVGQAFDARTVENIQRAVAARVDGLLAEQVNVRVEKHGCMHDLFVTLDAEVFEHDGELFSDPWGRIYAFDEAGQSRKAIHALFARVDSLRGQWGALTAWLQMCDLERLSLTLVVGIASITLSMKKHSPYRAEMMTKIKARVEALDPVRAQRLLWNLL